VPTETLGAILHGGALTPAMRGLYGSVRRTGCDRRSGNEPLRAFNRVGRKAVTMSLPFSERVTIVQDVLFRLVGEEAVLLNLKTDLYLGLDPVAARMWTLLKDTPSIQAAYDALLREYEVEPDRLRNDLDEFLGKLLEQGLIEVGPGEVSVGH
jgi:hypothetical protein